MDRDRRFVPEQFERIADALGEPDDGSGDGSRAVRAVRRMLAELEFETLQSVGVTEDRPRRAGRERARRLLHLGRPRPVVEGRGDRRLPAGAGRWVTPAAAQRPSSRGSRDATRSGPRCGWRRPALRWPARTRTGRRSTARDHGWLSGPRCSSSRTTESAGNAIAICTPGLRASQASSAADGGQPREVSPSPDRVAFRSTLASTPETSMDEQDLPGPRGARSPSTARSPSSPARPAGSGRRSPGHWPSTAPGWWSQPAARIAWHRWRRSWAGWLSAATSAGTTRFGASSSRPPTGAAGST